MARLAPYLYNAGRFAGYRIGHLKHFFKMSIKAVTVNMQSVNTVNHTHHREIHSQATQQEPTSTGSANENYDVIIAGGGMVGTTLACALGQNPMLCEKRILLLEGAAHQQYEPKEKYSNRVSALNHSTRRLLKQIGAWQHIEATRLCQVKKMQVWEATSDSVISFNNPHLEKPVAYIVENDVLLDAVSRQLSCTKVQVQYNSKIQGCDLSQPDKLSRVKLQSGEQFTCKLLVGADGAGSQVRKAIGGQYLAWSYDQMGVVATLRLSEPTENVVAWQRFLPTGPIAILPLTSELSSLVWSLPTEQAKQILQLPSDSFVDAVNDSLWKQYAQDSRVKEATQAVTKALASIIPLSASPGIQQLQPTIAGEEPNSRAAFPLGFGHATHYACQGAVLIGDAAHRVHPLAGQGVNLGFGDIQCLTEILAETVQNGGSLGQLQPLLNYERARQKHNLPLMLGVDGLHRLYTSNNPLVAIVRSVGVTLVDALTPVKVFFAKYAAT